MSLAVRLGFSNAVGIGEIGLFLLVFVGVGIYGARRILRVR